MKRTNEAVTRRFMKKLRIDLLGMSDREFNIVAPTLQSIIDEATMTRRKDLVEWEKKSIKKLDVLPVIKPLDA